MSDASKKFDIRDFEITEGLLVRDVKTYDDAIDAIIKINNKQTHIEKQLFVAKSKAFNLGEYADRDWFRSANVALSLTKMAKAYLHELKAQYVSENARLERAKRARQHDRYLIEALREQVGEETFRKIARNLEAQTAINGSHKEQDQHEQ